MKKMYRIRVSTLIRKIRKRKKRMVRMKVKTMERKRMER